MASTVYSNAMAEVLEYLKGIRQEDVNKIPVNVMNYFKTNANKDYVCKFVERQYLTLQNRRQQP